MRTRLFYIPIREAEVGMVLGVPLSVVHRGMLSLTFPDGHVLTEENLHQLNTRHAEFISVVGADPRSEEQVAVDSAVAAARVRQIFDGADLRDATMAALFAQVLAYRSV